MTRQELLQKITREAGGFIKAANPTTGATMKSEGNGNWVTATDLASEKIIIENIKAFFPDDTILAEETSNAIDHPEAAEHLWVIDPIDGTNNFRHGRGYSCVSVGYFEKGKGIAGAVYNPFAEEFFYGETGKGAWCNDQVIAVDAKESIIGTTVGTDCAYADGGTKEHLMMFLKISPSPWLMVRGSVALAMCDVAAGRLDCYFCLSAKPWDKAAGQVILEAAGGVMQTRDGKPASCFDETMVCGNQAVVADFIRRNQ